MCGSRSRARRCGRGVNACHGYGHNYNNTSPLLTHQRQCQHWCQHQNQCQNQRCGHGCGHHQTAQNTGIVNLVNAISDLAVSKVGHENGNDNTSISNNMNADGNGNRDIPAFNEKQVPYTTTTSTPNIDINELKHNPLPTGVSSQSPPAYSELPPSSRSLTTLTESSYISLLQSALQPLLQSHQDGALSKYQLKRSIRKVMNDIYYEEIERRERLGGERLRCKEKCAVWREMKGCRDELMGGF